MKKIVLVLVVLVFAAPSMAAVNITLTHVPDTNEVTIGFTSDEVNRVRAFGLNVQLDNDSNIVSVEGLHEGYWVYPGRIVIAADGTITDYGSIAAEYDDLPSDTLVGPPDGNGVTLECASLYAPVGPVSPNAPVQSGDLAKVIINGTDCQLCVTANVSRAGATGVVMENPDEVVTVVYACVDVNLPDPGQTECMKETHVAHAAWLDWGKPDCWCYAKQCRGDINGALYFGKPVTTADLNVFRNAFNKNDTDLALIENGICADFNMATYFGKRVTTADLNIFRTYFNLPDASVPECDKTNIWDWCVPGQPCPPTP